GKIKKIPLREIFKKEDKEFTPWIKENIDLLSEKLGIEIIDTQTEEKIGDFKLDIIGKDANTNKFVAVENQLESTDHNHLGQLITYSAGVNAGIIVWIAKELREEHKRALEWLNENSISEISFFGVEVHAISIDNSNPAVDLRVIVQPNDWERNIKSSTTLTETQIEYVNFFSKLVNSYSDINPRFRKVKAQPQNWLSFGAGMSGLSFDWMFRSGNIFWVELYIDTGDKIENKRIFDRLKNYKDKIDLEIKGTEWEEVETARGCRIVINRKTSGPIKSLKEKEKDDLIKWGSEQMKAFSSTFYKYINKI
ncbi:unnamed protein product, partial [marine sediment metagenome]